MKVVYKILNNQYKVTMKHFYHIRCDPDLDKVLCAMRRISCACTGCVQQLSNTWLSNLDEHYNHVMLLKPKHVSTLPSYLAIINSILPNWLFKKKQQTQTIWRLNMSLSWTARLGHQQTIFNTIPLVNFKPATVTRLDIIFFDGQVMHIPYRENIHIMHSILRL